MKKSAGITAVGIMLPLCGALGAESTTLSPDQYINQISACAGGLRISVSGELLGSIKEIYEGKRTAGREFRFSSTGEFISLMPEKDRLEAYKLYIGCIAGGSLSGSRPSKPVPYEEGYSVLVKYIDNRIEVLVNGTLVLNALGNGEFDIRHDIRKYIKKGDNDITINGFNGAYGASWHDPNPAKITYSITRNDNKEEVIPTVTCTGPDIRVPYEVLFCQQIYRLHAD